MEKLRVPEQELDPVAHDGGYGFVYHYKGHPFTGILVADDDTFEQEYIDGYRNGIIRTYYSAGKLESDGITLHGCLHGVYKEYYETGELKSEMEYDMDRVVSGKDFDVHGNVIQTYPLVHL